MNFAPILFAGDVAVSAASSALAIPASPRPPRVRLIAAQATYMLPGVAGSSVATGQGMFLAAGVELQILLNPSWTQLNFVAAGAGTVNATFGAQS